MRFHQIFMQLLLLGSTSLLYYLAVGIQAAPSDFKDIINAGSKSTRELVASYCNNGLDFTDTNEFVLKFVPALKKQLEEDRGEFSPSEGMRLCKRDKDAIFQLGELLGQNQDDVCHPENIDKIINYHKRFIEHHEELVASRYITRNLFKTYVLQVDYVCKKNLLHNLKEETAKGKIEETDFLPVIPWATKRRVTIDSYSFPVQNFDDFVVPEFKETEPRAMDTVPVTQKSVKAIAKMQKMCQNKMRPVYETTILPVSTLARMGYSYQSEIFRDELNVFRQDGDVRRWYLVTEVCELFRTIKIERNAKENGLNHAITELQDDRTNLKVTWPKHSANDRSRDGSLTVKKEPFFEAQLLMQTNKKHKCLCDKFGNLISDKPIFCKDIFKILSRIWTQRSEIVDLFNREMESEVTTTSRFPQDDFLIRALALVTINACN